MRRTHTESCVLGHLGQLHPVVSEVVHQDHQRSDPANMEDNKYLVDRRIEEVSCSPEHLRGPAEGEQGEGGEVVDEHLPPVLQHLVSVSSPDQASSRCATMFGSRY